jgi:signal transduction histidine kinase
MRQLHLSLRYKFVLTLVGFTLAVTVPFGLLSITRFTDELESQERTKWKTTAEGIAPFLFANSAVLRVLAPEDRSANCEKVKQRLGSEVLYLRFSWGTENLCFVKAATLSTVAETYLEAPASQPGVTIEKVYVRGGTDFLSLNYSDQVIDSQPVTDSSGRVGTRFVTVPTYLRLGISMANVQAQVRREATMIALVVFGYVLLGLLIAFAFYKMILGPVESLAAALNRFKSDPSARASVATGDELETLAHEFNKMADAIEERKRQLEEINAALVKANHAKSDFLAMMSHELKTPLHAIRGYSQLLLEELDGPLTQAQRDDLQNILNSGDHLLQLIDNILRFSKLEASEDQLYFEAIEASTIGEEAIRAVGALARGKGLELSYKTEPCTLIADATKLKQALINLLSNAIKYTPSGRVALSGTVHDNEYWFSVSDTGIGIPEHERERIFEPFTQLDSSNTRESQGVGLGLAIVKKYIEMHGGRVDVQSEVGRGSVFYIVLPFEAPYPEKEEGNRSEGEQEVSHAHSHR